MTIALGNKAMNAQLEVLYDNQVDSISNESRVAQSEGPSQEVIPTNHFDVVLWLCPFWGPKQHPINPRNNL